jgi:hypothetical protein
MQPIKTLIVSVALAATAAFAQAPEAFAQARDDSARPGSRAGFARPPYADIERLAVLLDLDAYQKTQVERVFTEQREGIQAERKAHESSGERPSFDAMRALREQSRAETITKLQDILTEQQITKLKLLMEPPAGPRGRRGALRDGGEPAAADGGK